MTEMEQHVLALYRKLDTEEKKIVLDAIWFFEHCPGFSEAERVDTPAGEVAPPAKVTKRHVAEWMAKATSGKCFCADSPCVRYVERMVANG